MAFNNGQSKLMLVGRPAEQGQGPRGKTYHAKDGVGPAASLIHVCLTNVAVGCKSQHQAMKQVLHAHTLTVLSDNI
jgi:hypothetical protein